MDFLIPIGIFIALAVWMVILILNPRNFFELPDDPWEDDHSGEVAKSHSGS